MEAHGRQVDPFRAFGRAFTGPAAELEADPESDAPAGPLDEALAIARAYEHEGATRLGIVSMALLQATAERAELWGQLLRPGHWLEDTCAIQRNDYELEPEGVGYVKEQATAAIVELAEMLQELPWKSERDGLPGREPTEAEKAKARKELLDALTFLGNIAVALEFDDETIWREMNDLACRNVSKRRGLGKAAK